MMKLKFSTILIILFSGLIAAGCSNSLDVWEGEPVSTNIGYNLLDETHVKLWVENSYKTTIVTLVDDVQPAGNYQVTFVAVDSDGNNLPEGVYTYHIKTDEHSQSRLMHLFYD